jgi:uncharacterized protein YggU (UPF0235/DUF167 family)
MAFSVSLVCKPGSTAPGMSIIAGVLQLRVRERAIEGAANDACIRALAEALNIPKSSVHLQSGAHSRQKRFAIEGVDEQEARRRLRLEPP